MAVDNNGIFSRHKNVYTNCAILQTFCFTRISNYRYDTHFTVGWLKPAVTY